MSLIPSLSKPSIAIMILLIAVYAIIFNDTVSSILQRYLNTKLNYLDFVKSFKCVPPLRPFSPSSCTTRSTVSDKSEWNLSVMWPQVAHQEAFPEPSQRVTIKHECTCVFAGENNFFLMFLEFKSFICSRNEQMRLITSVT